MYGIDTLIAINKGNLGQGKGAIYEALVFDSLSKANIEPYYFAKESGLEVDFVISYNGYATLIEAKAKNGNTKSSKTIMKNKEHYGKTKLIKIGDYNVGCSEDILTIPHYLTFLLGVFSTTTFIFSSSVITRASRSLLISFSWVFSASRLAIAFS